MENRIHILGSNVDALTMNETLDMVQQLITNRKCTQHVAVNASKINLMQGNEKLTNIINNCPLINADGQSIVWAARFFGKKIPERVTGIDLFLNIIKLSSEKGYKVYFFGARQNVIEKVVQVLKNQYHNLNIVGYRNGYFTDEKSREIADEIRRVQTDILFVGFSSPKKEYWINEYIQVMQVPFAMGVGGSFDIVAGITKRAPKWMQKCGLEWFYRFIQEPIRMWKRYILGNIKFLSLVVTYKMKSLRKDCQMNKLD